MLLPHLPSELEELEKLKELKVEEPIIKSYVKIFTINYTNYFDSVTNVEDNNQKIKSDTDLIMKSKTNWLFSLIKNTGLALSIVEIYSERPYGIYFENLHQKLLDYRRK